MSFRIGSYFIVQMSKEHPTGTTTFKTYMKMSHFSSNSQVRTLEKLTAVGPAYPQTIASKCLLTTGMERNEGVKENWSFSESFLSDIAV